MKGPFFKISEMLDGNIPLIDAHVHTELTDGKGTIEDYIAKAKELNLKTIAFTEHADNTSAYYNAYINNKGYYKELAFPLEVYFGAEVKLANLEGAINISDERASVADFVVGVLHSYPDSKGGYLKFKELEPAGAMNLDYKLSKALVTNPNVDVFGHPCGVYANYFGKYDTDKLRELITIAVNNNKVIELNSAERYRHVFPVIFQRCVELDCLVSIGSDAHTTAKLGHIVSFLRDYIKNYR
ncbi:MAG TPA: PHP domain-containing protein [Segetibacter sp.]|jgi:putative hydrolase